MAEHGRERESNAKHEEQDRSRAHKEDAEKGEVAHNHVDGEGRDRPPSDRERDPKSPWLGGG